MSGQEADDGGMSVALLAVAFLAAPSDESLTAGQVYEGCTRLLAQGAPVPPSSGHSAEAYCDAIATLDLAAADAMRLVSDGQPAETSRYCLPDAIVEASDASLLQRAFIAYVDAHPAVRSEDGAEIFEQALADKWPCPR